MSTNGPTDPAPLAGGRFSYLFVMAREFDVMCAFYRDVLALPLAYFIENGSAFFELPGQDRLLLAIYPGREDTPGDTHGAANHWFIVIDVPELDTAIARLEQRSVRIGPVQDVPFGRAATFADPEGNVIELHASV